MFVRASRVIIPHNAQIRSLTHLLSRTYPEGCDVRVSQIWTDDGEAYVFDFLDVGWIAGVDRPAFILLDASDFVSDDWGRMQFFKEKGPPDADEERYVVSFPEDCPE